MASRDRSRNDVKGNATGRSWRSEEVKAETGAVTNVIGDTPLLWPQALAQPPRPPRLVYLDLNHWIALAQADTGHAQGAGFRGVLDACTAAKASGTALFPLSAAHYFEMYKIKDPRQRQDIAAVMEELSGFTTLVSRSVVMVAEVRAVLDTIAGSEASPERGSTY